MRRSPASAPACALLSLLLLALRSADVAASYVVGLPLVAALCSPGNDSQSFTFAAGGSPTYGTIVHRLSSLCVEAWPGNDLGFSARLLLQTCRPGHPWQKWLMPAATSGTIRNNVTRIWGCRGWNNFGSNLAEGNEVGPYGCDDVPPVDELFTFSAGTGTFTLAANPLWCVAVEQATASAPTGSYVLDDSLPNAKGPAFDGVGVIGSGGASRLLFDYAPDVRAAVLDALFLPAAQGGLNPHLLRIEIGGDSIALSGAEPSHQHFAGEPSQAATRGTQVWLAQQARLRNPNIKLYAVPHSWPGFLGAAEGDLSPFGTPASAAAAAQYVVDWLLAVTAAGLEPVDFVGVYDSFWDSSLSAAYIKVLRAALNAQPALISTRIVCGDTSAWSCSEAAALDTGLLSAVAVFGEHVLPLVTTPTFADKPRWLSSFTSGDANLRTGGDLARAISEAFVVSNLTGFLSFAAVGASYNTLPGFRAGAVEADQPWSGFWDLTPTWYALAHTTQFASTSMLHLNVGSGSGTLWRGGQYITRYDPVTFAFSVVLTKLSGGNQAEDVTFALGTNLANAVSANGGTLSLFTTCFGASGANSSFFVKTTVLMTGNAVTLWLFPNCIATLTTVAGQGPVRTGSDVPAVPTAFFGQSSDDFAKSALGGTARFWSDIHGAFEVVDDPSAGRGLQLKATWPRPLNAAANVAHADLRPHTIFGDSTWRDSDATVRFFLPKGSDCAGLGLRVSSFNDSSLGAFGAADGRGVWLGVCTTSWLVFSDLDRTKQPVSQGRLVIPLVPGTWHTMRLILRGDSAVALLDSNVVLAHINVSTTRGFPSLGFMGLATGEFGDTTIFGAYSVSALGTTCSSVPKEGDEPRMEPCQAGTPGQSLLFIGQKGQIDGSGNTPGSILAAYNLSLCLQMDDASGPDYGYQQTRKVNLTLCDVAERRQQFTVEASALDGADGVIGPIQGPDGLVLNLYRWGDTDDTEIRAYPWQSTSNELFAWDRQTESIFVPYEGLCMSFCDKE